MIWNDTKRDAAASFIRRRDLIAFGRPTTTVGCRGRSSRFRLRARDVDGFKDHRSS